jgi:transposase
MSNSKEQHVAVRYGPKGRFSVAFIKKVVQELEEGAALQDTRMNYGLSGRLLRCWLNKYASATYLQSLPQRHSIQDKRSVCRAIRDGKMTVSQAVSSYGVGATTVYEWLKMENDDLSVTNTDVLKKKPKEILPVLSPPADVKALQEQLAYANLKIAALNTLIDVAEEQLKINIRKKPGAKQS